MAEDAKELVDLEGTERILFVDDEEILALMGCRILKNLGYTVRSCSSSADALELLRHEPESFDLVVSDLTMPGMTGLELARQLHAFRPELPVVLMSGYGDKSVADSHVSLFVRKPFGPEEIGKAVRDVLNRSVAA